MANIFGGPSAKGAFLTGTASSVLGGLAQNYKDEREKEERDKMIDYQLLMKALEAMHDDMTPSAVQEVLTRGADIFKPKGHGGIKENIKGIFGGQQPHQMESGDILKGAMQKPRLNVQQPTQTAQPGGTGVDQVRARTVTLPPPPQSKPESTYREQGIEDEIRKSDEILRRQMTMEDLRNEHRDKQRREQNDAILKRYVDEFKIKDTATAERDIDKRAALYGDYRDPDNRERARADLAAENKQKVDMLKARMTELQNREKDRVERRKIAEHRIAIAERRDRRAQASGKGDPWVTQADSKIKMYTNLATAERKKAADAYAAAGAATGDTATQWLEQAEAFNKQAEADENIVDETVNGKAEYLEGRGNPWPGKGGVKLPNAPTGQTVTMKQVQDAATANGVTTQQIIQNLPKGTRVVK